MHEAGIIVRGDEVAIKICWEKFSYLIVLIDFQFKEHESLIKHMQELFPDEVT